MGYGPLVRATTGVTWQWTSEDAPRGSFYDATTIFPDHISARLTAIAALAAVIGRDRTGTGAHVHISQAEAAVNQLATAYVAEAARAARLPVAADTAVHTVYRCDGDDEWCVISLRHDADRVALAAITGDTDVSEWTRTRDKTAVAEELQGAGVPAAPMYRAVDVLADPQITLRKVFSEMTHPLLDAPMPTETGPAPYLHIAPAELRPAPMPGEHTREICQKLLALDADETDRLIAEGVLFTQQGRS
jgi:crotonobetainyl-CoA:carnitine CoA-transferase CaiB-like acyl-CoA transferase